MTIKNANLQLSEWKRKSWSIPDLYGGKQNWYALVVELVRLMDEEPVSDLSLYPEVQAVDKSRSWHDYAPFLKGIGLAINRAGKLHLTDMGHAFSQTPRKDSLATCIHNKYRLVGETLELLKGSPKTIEDANVELSSKFDLHWINLNNIRRRMDWLEVLGLIEGVGNRKWGLTPEGEALLNELALVSPEVLATSSAEPSEISISPAPNGIERLLDALKSNPEQHESRNTYNIWVPSPNKIENVRTIVQFASEKVSRSELFEFVGNEFNLKASSVESMLPFLKADGFLEEVGRNLYLATPPAREWCESGNDLDFVRILHSQKRFVGELIVAAKQETPRNDIYSLSTRFGLNTEKTRWIIGFLLEAGLLEETRYLHLKATPLGLALVTELPLMEIPDETVQKDASVASDEKAGVSKNLSESQKAQLFDTLQAASTDPLAEGKASGAAFEECIAAVFRYMGFEAKHIGGSGDTDVVVRWRDQKGETVLAVVDGKSKSSGTVAHSDISDIAIETHKEKNNAKYVAIVGPGFSGNTIKEYAQKKGFALITATELINIARTSQEIGLSLSEISLLFKVPNGLSQLEETIATRKRELEIISLVVSTFNEEQEAIGSLSARDLFLLSRKTNMSPTMEELLDAFDILSKKEVGFLHQINSNTSSENITYAICGKTICVNRLRAIASAIEDGLM